MTPEDVAKLSPETIAGLPVGAWLAVGQGKGPNSRFYLPSIRSMTVQALDLVRMKTRDGTDCVCQVRRVVYRNETLELTAVELMPKDSPYCKRVSTAA